MTGNLVIFDQRDRVGIITLNRPEKLNSLTPDMQTAIRAQIEAWNEDPSVGAIVLTGTGRGFCTGADVGGWNTAIEQREAGETPEYITRVRPAESWFHFVTRSKPIVCAINGMAVGVGLVNTLPCDVRIGSDQARFSMRMVRMALPPEGGSTVILPHIIGMGHALELMLSGRIIDAQEAGRIGLVNRVVPHDELMDHAFATAAEIAFNPTDCLAAAKRLAWHNYLNRDLDDVLAREGAELAIARDNPEFKEAVTAFLEERQPNFHP